MERLQFWRFDSEAIRALLSVDAHLARSGFEPGLLDLVWVRVSQLTDCSYCEEAHTRQAIDYGVEQRLVDAVADWRQTSLFTDRQRAALAWAESVTEVAKTKVPDAVYREAASQFSEIEFVNLTVAIALMNAFARIAVAFRHGPPPIPAQSAMH